MAHHVAVVCAIVYQGCPHLSKLLCDIRSKHPHNALGYRCRLLQELLSSGVTLADFEPPEEDDSITGMVLKLVWFSIWHRLSYMLKFTRILFHLAVLRDSFRCGAYGTYCYGTS